MRLSARAALFCALITRLVCGQVSPTIINVTNAAIPALDIPPATVHLAPRSLGIIFGSNLADSTGSASVPSVSLGGTEVHLASDTCFDSSCDLVAKLMFGSPTQINFVVPDDGSATCTNCTPKGYRIVFIRNGQRFDNRAYGSGGPGRIFIDPSNSGDNNVVFSVGYDCLFSYSLSDPSSCGLSASPGLHRAPLGAVTDAANFGLISSGNPAHQGQFLTLWMTAVYGGVAPDSGSGLWQQANPKPVGFGVAQFGQDMANTITAGAYGPVGALMTPTPVWIGEQPQTVGLDQINVAFPTCTNVPPATVESRYDAFLTYTNSETRTNARVYVPFVVRPGDPDCRWLLGSTTTLSSNINPSAAGQTVTFAATVSPAAATGNVTFFDGTNALGTADLGPGVPLSGGAPSSMATFSTAALSAGIHSIVAVYGGNAAYQSSSAVLVQTVKATTTTIVTSSSNPSQFGHLTFSAAVSPADATGTMTFYDGLQVFGTVTVNNGRATVDGGNLVVGSHSILAKYGGDPKYQESSGTLTQIVIPGTPTTTLSSSANPITAGQTVVFTVNICCNVTGTVTFFDGSSQLGVGSVGPDLPISGGSTSSGRATLSTSFLGIGIHQITARYSGDGNNSPVTSNVFTQTVNGPGNTTITLAPNLNPSTAGQNVIFVAVVSPSGATGTVTFYDGGAVLGASTIGASAPISGGSSAGTATLAVSFLSVGTHYISARYNGDSTYNPATSATLAQVVTALVNTTVGLSSERNPSLFGDAVTFVASIAPPSATGVVTFLDGNVAIGSAMIGSPFSGTSPGIPQGVATFTTAGLSLGTHLITARYDGDSRNSGSFANLLQTVNPR